MPDNRRFLLQRRPDGEPVAEDFELVTQPSPDLDEGQFLIRNHYASLDPATRGWMDAGGNYMPPVPLGSAMRASTIGVVEDSRAAGFEPGQWVMGLNALEDYSVGITAAAGAVGSLAGQLAIDEHIDVGREHAFDSFMRLFAGTNDGKMILQIAR